jgi:hypothetical protein
MRNSNFADSIASSMGEILKDPKFKEVTGTYQDALAEDSNYQAFVRIAKKKNAPPFEVEKAIEENADGDEGDGKDLFTEEDGGTYDPKTNKKYKDKKKDKKKKGKDKDDEDDADCGSGMYASALRHITEQFTSTSEALENMGLNKSAAKTLLLLDGIVKEAYIKLALNPQGEDPRHGKKDKNNIDVGLMDEDFEDDEERIIDVGDEDIDMFGEDPDVTDDFGSRHRDIDFDGELTFEDTSLDYKDDETMNDNISDYESDFDEEDEEEDEDMAKDMKYAFQSLKSLIKQGGSTADCVKEVRKALKDKGIDCKVTTKKGKCVVHCKKEEMRKCKAACKKICEKHDCEYECVEMK